LVKTRKELHKKLLNLDIHPEEILMFSDKFTFASRKIHKYMREQQRIERKLRINNHRELRSMGRGLAVPEKRREIEGHLGMSADQIKEKIEELISKANRDLNELEIELDS